MAVTKVCKACMHDYPIEELTCADSRCRIPECATHSAGPESIPGCDEIYCPNDWEKFKTDKKIG
jgi:hypothetical protein